MPIDFISYQRVSSYQLMWILIMFDLPTETELCVARKYKSTYR